MGWEWRCFWRLPDSYGGCVGGERRIDVYFNSGSSNVGIKQRGERQDGYYEVKTAISKLDSAENLQKRAIKLNTRHELLHYISNVESSSSSPPPAVTSPVNISNVNSSSSSPPPAVTSPINISNVNSSSPPPAVTSPIEMFRMDKSRDKRFCGTYVAEWCLLNVQTSLDNGVSWSNCGRWLSLCVENVKPPELQACIDTEIKKKKSAVEDLGQPFLVGSYAEFVCVLSELIKNPLSLI